MHRETLTSRNDPAPLSTTAGPRLGEGGASAARTRALMLTLVAMGVLCAAYLLHVVSPLRVYSDGITYLRMAEVAAAGRSLAEWPFPPGYPFVLSVFHRIGLLNSITIVALNCAFIAIGLWASYRILRSAFGLGVVTALVICLGTLLAWNFIKHVALPNSDIPFFATSALALFALMRADERQRRRGAHLVLAGVLAIVAIQIRAIGIALVPALVWAAVRPRFRGSSIGEYLRGPKRTSLLLVATGVLLAFGVAAVFLVPATYVEILSRLYGTYFDGTLSGVLRLAGDRLTGAGEVVSNLPLSYAPRGAGVAWAIAGVAAIAGIGVGMWRRQRWDGFEVFGLSYVGIFLACPCSDRGRYLLPVIPLLAGWLVLAIAPLTRRSAIVRWGVIAYAAVFTLAGIAALGYSLSLSLSRSFFLARYGDGAMQPTYRVAFGVPIPGDSSRADPEALRLLKTYSQFGVDRSTGHR